MVKTLMRIGEYELNYDERYNIYTPKKDGLELLLYELVEQTSYRIDGEYCLTAYDEVEAAKEKISGAKYMINGFSKPQLPNYSPMYRDIKKATINYNGWRDIIDFYGSKVIAPELATIIRRLLSLSGCDEYDINDFLDYERSEEILTIDAKIALTNRKLARLDDDNYYDRIQLLRHLADLYEIKASGYYFDGNLLRKFYDRAYDMMEFHEVNEKNEEVGNVLKLSAFNRFLQSKHIRD